MSLAASIFAGIFVGMLLYICFALTTISTQIKAIHEHMEKQP